jgi:hypothetical protein
MIKTKNQRKADNMLQGFLNIDDNIKKIEELIKQTYKLAKEKTYHFTNITGYNNYKLYQAYIDINTKNEKIQTIIITDENELKSGYHYYYSVCSFSNEAIYLDNLNNVIQAKIKDLKI